MMWQALRVHWKLIRDLPRHLQILGVAVVALLIANIVITLLLYVSISSQQNLINERYKPIHQTSALHYSYLNLTATLENGSRNFNRYLFAQQIATVEDQIQDVVAPVSSEQSTHAEASAAYSESLQSFVTRWNNIKPFLVEWSTKPTSNYLRQILLESSEQQDSTLVTLRQIAKNEYQQQLAIAEISTRQTLGQLASVSIIWAVLAALFGINSLSFLREQHRSKQELLHAKEAADVANEAKSAFLSNMSHEMRTPLNAIMGLTHLAINESGSAVQRGYLQSVNSSSQELLLLIEEVLNVSQAGVVESISTVEEFAPAELIDDLVAQFAKEMQTAGVVLRSHINHDVPLMVTGDRTNLCIVLQKLIHNAFKFSDDSVLISASLMIANNGTQPNSGHQSETPITLAWSVQDTGYGIPLEQQKKIFEPFQQVDNSSTRKFGGTGLGLSICKQLVELMGGEIVVESEEGAGSTFTVTTPMMLPKAQPSGERPAAYTAPTTSKIRSSDSITSQQFTPQNVQHRRTSIQTMITKQGAEPYILVVEDTPLNQKIVSLILERAGYQFEVADNGARAVEKYNELAQYGAGFDLILMDLQMPEMNGFDATKAIRSVETETHQQVPIIALTANAVEGVREQCLQVGMNEYLTKPIAPDVLIETIQRFLASPVSA